MYNVIIGSLVIRSWPCDSRTKTVNNIIFTTRSKPIPTDFISIDINNWFKIEHL